MSDGKAYEFGDVVRVDPAKNPSVPQPDDRRWIVIAFDERSKWTLLYAGAGDPKYRGSAIVHFGSLYGFIEVEP